MAFADDFKTAAQQNNVGLMQKLLKDAPYADVQRVFRSVFLGAVSTGQIAALEELAAYAQENKNKTPALDNPLTDRGHANEDPLTNIALAGFIPGQTAAQRALARLGLGRKNRPIQYTTEQFREKLVALRRAELVPEELDFFARVESGQCTLLDIRRAVGEDNGLGRISLEDTTNAQGDNCAHIFAKQNNAQALHMLGHNGIDLNVRNIVTGNTPAHYLSASGSEQALAVLAHFKVDIDTPNMAGKTARESLASPAQALFEPGNLETQKIWQEVRAQAKQNISQTAPWANPNASPPPLVPVFSQLKDGHQTVKTTPDPANPILKSKSAGSSYG